jgi:hypothetical protein
MSLLIGHLPQRKLSLPCNLESQVFPSLDLPPRASCCPRLSFSNVFPTNIHSNRVHHFAPCRSAFLPSFSNISSNVPPSRYSRSPQSSIRLWSSPPRPSSTPALPDRPASIDPSPSVEHSPSANSDTTATYDNEVDRTLLARKEVNGKRLEREGFYGDKGDSL